MMQKILLIDPPQSRNVAPPLRLGILCGYLKSLGVSARILDLNAECALNAAFSAQSDRRTRSIRAIRNINQAIGKLQSPDGYKRYAVYTQLMEYYATALQLQGKGEPWTIFPGDYRDERFQGLDRNIAGEVIDGFASNIFTRLAASKTTETVADFKPGVIGVSIQFRSQFIPAVSIAAWLRRNYPHIRLVGGGGLFRSLPVETVHTLKTIFNDICAIEGEDYFRKLLGASGEPDYFAMPDWDGVDFHRYFAPGHVLPVTATRGCFYGGCAFCAERAVTYRKPDPAEFMNRLRASIQAMRPEMVHFTDNALPSEMLETIAGSGLDTPWYGFVRPSKKLEDAAFIDRLAGSGCRMLQLGIESPVKRVLKLMNKGTSHVNFEKILANLERSGIASYVYLMFGFPGQTIRDMEASMEWLERNPVTFLNPSIFRLPAESAMSRNPEKFDIRIEDVPAGSSLYLDYDGDGISKRELRRWMSTVFFRHPAVRELTARTPRYYKSSHAIFFCGGGW